MKNNQILIDALEKQLENSEQMWNEGHSHAYIVGYLQGVIKATIEELKHN
jgi:hypothetical protein